MAFDGLFLHAMIQELKSYVLKGRVTKIYQPYAHEIILKIRNQRKNYQLLLVADPVTARIQLTDEKYDNPLQAPQFLMVLRKYLERTTLDQIEQVENDRQVILHFSGHDELGDRTTYHLHLEIMGRHSNLSLVDAQGNILEVIRHVPMSQNSYRTLLPGAQYVLPPSQNKINPFRTFSWPLSESPSWKEIQQTFQGFGKESAQEVVWQMRIDKEHSAKQTFNHFIEKFANQPFHPTLTTKNNKQAYTVFPYQIMEGERTSFATLSLLLDTYYQRHQHLSMIKQRFNDVSQTLTHEIKKAERKIKKLNDELNSTVNKEKYRIQGEVLTAFMHQAEQGMKQITLPNFYDDNKELTIPLDPLKSPAENAQALFSTYQKLKNREVFATDQLKKAQADLDYLYSIEAAIPHANLEELEEIKQELIKEGFLRKQKQKKTKRNQKTTPYEEYQASDGTKILVGKNNYQNDQLTTKIAKRTHWWLHTKDIPGSHVIIVDQHPSDKTQLEAAEIAAYFSKYQFSSNVPVDITQVKNVRKPNGARPGYVIYEDQETLFVTPDEANIKQRKV